MTDFEYEEGRVHAMPLSREDKIRADLGEFDDGSEGEYARLTSDYIPPYAGGIALQPPGTERVLVLNQS